MDFLTSYIDNEDIDDDGGMHTDDTITATVMCMVCDAVPKQYKCPRCSIFTCSLICCKKHKTTSKCNGIRDRTTYVQLNEFNRNNLRNDYHFLEDVLQLKNSAKRSVMVTSTGKDGKGNSNTGNAYKRGNKRNQRHKKDDEIDAVVATPLIDKTLQALDSYTAGVKKFVHAVRSRGTNVLLMPCGMNKRISNSSTYRMKSDEVMWKVNIVFVLNDNYDIPSLLRYDIDGLQFGSVDGIGDIPFLGVSIRSVSENQCIDALLQEYFEHRDNNAVHRHTLRKMRVNAADICVLMQRIPSSASSPTFLALPNRTDRIRDVLVGKTIIEYPTFYVGEQKSMQKLRLFIGVTTTAAAEEGEEGQATTSDDKEHDIANDRKRCISDDNNEGIRKVVRIDEDNQHDYDSSDDDVDMEQDDFFAALQEMEGKDINALKEMIQNINE